MGKKVERARDGTKERVRVWEQRLVILQKENKRELIDRRERERENELGYNLWGGGRMTKTNDDP